MFPHKNRPLFVSSSKLCAILDPDSLAHECAFCAKSCLSLVARANMFCCCWCSATHLTFMGGGQCPFYVAHDLGCLLLQQNKCHLKLLRSFFLLQCLKQKHYACCYSYHALSVFHAQQKKLFTSEFQFSLVHI